MRMLLVEDNRQLAEMLTKSLQAAGYDADHLATSAEARSVLTTTRYAALDSRPRTAGRRWSVDLTRGSRSEGPLADFGSHGSGQCA